MVFWDELLNGSIYHDHLKASLRAQASLSSKKSIFGE